MASRLTDEKGDDKENTCPEALVTPPPGAMINDSASGTPSLVFSCREEGYLTWPQLYLSLHPNAARPAGLLTRRRSICNVQLLQLRPVGPPGCFQMLLRHPASSPSVDSVRPPNGAVARSRQTCIQE